ncbi:MAG: hypothetical protein ABI182_04035 [Candidatus Baltobacteraceae bacterium]
MIIVQRLFALALAAGFIFAFLIPTAMHRHQYGVVWLLLVIFFGWIGVNAYLFVRSRKQR